MVTITVSKSSFWEISLSFKLLLLGLTLVVRQNLEIHTFLLVFQVNKIQIFKIYPCLLSLVSVVVFHCSTLT